MKTVEDYNNYLVANGYMLSDQPFSFVDGELVGVSYVNMKTRKHVELYCHYDDDLIDELVDNAVEETDVWTERIRKMAVVSSILVESNIVNMSNYVTGEKSGIILNCNVDDPDISFTGNYFEEAIWIQNNETQHAMNIMKHHFENIDFFNKEIRPIIESYYIEMYDSMIDILEKETSDPFFTWGVAEYQGDYEIIFSTDCITGEFMISIPYGLYGKANSAVFKDVVNCFNRDEFLEAMNLSLTRAKKIEDAKHEADRIEL